MNSITLTGEANRYAAAFILRQQALLAQNRRHPSSKSADADSSQFSKGSLPGTDLPTLPADMSQYEQAGLLMSVIRESGVYNPVAVLSCCPSIESRNPNVAGCSGEFASVDRRGGICEYSYLITATFNPESQSVATALNYAQKSRRTTTDRLIDKGIKQVGNAFEAMLQPIFDEITALDKRKLSSAEKYSRLRRKLNSKGLYAKINAIGQAELVDILAQAMIASDLAGRHDVLSELDE